MTSTVNTAGSNISGGTLEGAAGGDLVVIQNSPQPFTINSAIANNTSATGLTKSGSGTLLLYGANAYSGPTYVNGGTLQVSAAALPASTSVALAGGANLTIDDGGATASFSAPISGNGSLTKIGSGTALLGPASRTYSGITHVTAGTLQLPSLASIASAYGSQVAGLPGLNAWYNASNVTTNGTTVTGWTDLSGLGHSAGSAQTGTETLITGQANGLPAVQFASAAWSAISGTLFSKEQYMVFKSPSGNSYNGDWGAVMGDVSEQQGYMMGNGTNFWNGNYPAAVSQNGTVLANPWNISNMGSYLVLKVDGAYTSTAGTKSYSLGNVYGNGSAQYHNLNLDVAEVLSFSSTLSSSQEALVGDYLSAKYGIGTTYPAAGLPSASAVVLDANAALDLNGNLAQTVASLSGGAGSLVTLESGALTTGGDNTNTTFAGNISGAGGSLTKVGNGTMTLGAANTFTGPTTISSGALQLGNSNALANSSPVTVNVSQGLLFGSGVTAANLHLLSDTGSLALTNADGNGVALGVTGGSLSGVVSGSGSVTANMSGSQLLVENARNTYSGATVINGGIFQANDGGGLPAASPLTLNNAVLQSDGPAVFNRSVGSGLTLTGTNGFAATGGHFTVTLNGGAQLTWNNNMVFGSPLANNVVELTNGINLAGTSGTVQVTAGAGGDSALLSGNVVDSTNSSTTGLYKTGSGVLALSGSNTFAGGVTVAQGTVQMAGANALGSLAPTVTFSETNPTDLQLNGNALSPTLAASPSNWLNATIENGNANPNPATLTLNPAANMTFAGTLRDGANAGPLGITKLGTNTLTLSGANGFSGPANVTGGTLQGSAANLTGPVVLANNANVTFNQPITAVYGQTVSGTGSLTKTGSGTLRLASPQTYTGNTYVNQGTLTVIPPTPAAISSLPGLNAWFSASSLNTTYANGQSVTTWPDLSGNGNTATLTAGNLTFVTNQIDGFPAVQFTNNGYANIAGSMYSAEQYIVFNLQNSGGWGSVLGSQVRSGYLLNPGGYFWGSNEPVAVEQNGTSLPLSTNYQMSNIGNFMVLKIDGNASNTTVRTGWALGRQEGWNSPNMEVAEVLSFSNTLSFNPGERRGRLPGLEVRNQHHLLGPGSLQHAPGVH